MKNAILCTEWFYSGFRYEKIPAIKLDPESEAKKPTPTVIAICNNR